MFSIERVRELIKLGNENRNLDYKSAIAWDEADADQKCEITKDILAFSNTPDGGVILIGVHDKTGEAEGLTQDQYASFDQTKLNAFVHKYTDPRHTVNVHRIVLDERRLVVIDIPEFNDVPILCARDAHSSTNQKRLILRRAALYKRTDKATSEVIEDATEMRELLNRGLLRRQDDLLRAIKQLIQPREPFAMPEPGAEFKSEIENTQHYFAELDAGNFAQLPRWTVEMRPNNYIADRLPSAAQLQKLVDESAISLRGWSFPIAGRISGATWTNFANGSQSFVAPRMHSPEALRVYKSGLMIWTSGFWEDYSLSDKKDVLSFIGVIFAVTEWLLFARRFFEAILPPEERVVIAVHASGIKGRRLISAQPGVHIFEDYSTALSSFDLEEAVNVSDLRAEPEALARRIIRRVFELFNWNNPDENMLHNWQQKLITRTL